MAGAGYKLFNTGDVLTAAQVNTYLMEQTVMVFASAAARTTALSGVLAEGMVSYLQDTNTLEVYNGSAWVGATGDITEVQAGTGISVASGTGPVPVVTNTVATTFDAKGDLVVGTGADTFAKLVVGNSGESIVADSSQTTGLRYNPPVASLGNPIINGGMDIWQRGTSIGGLQQYTADRWFKQRGADAAGLTVSRQTTNDTTNLPNIQYCARLQRDSGNTSTQTIFFINCFETTNSIPFAGKAITLSFYARAGANFSPTSSLFVGQIYSGTGTDQNLQVSGYTGLTTVANTALTATTTWQRFVVTGTIPATATEISVRIEINPTGTAGANDWLEVTGFQIDVGTYTASSAPTFRRSANTLAGELAACQRYYWRAGGNAAFQGFGNGIGFSTTKAQVLVKNPVPMRTVPTGHGVNLLGLTDTVTTTGITASAIVQSGINENLFEFTVASGLTQYRPYIVNANNSTSAYLDVTAEL